MSNQENVYKLNWDPITVEGYNSSMNEVSLIFNYDITSEEKLKNVIKYVVGRVMWCSINFPDNLVIKLSFDIRGQEIIMNRSNKFKSDLLEIFNKLKINSLILIDFLR